MTDYGVTHGRAVGIGMAVIFRGCVRAGLCDPQALPVLEHLLEKFGLTGLCPVSIRCRGASRGGPIGQEIGGERHHAYPARGLRAVPHGKNLL